MAIRRYIQQLTAAHTAEKVDLNLRIENMRVLVSREHAEALVDRYEQGRREALQGLPVDALIYATLLLRLEAGNIESVVSSKTVSTYDRQISRLIESVRAAQQEETK